ncbi:MAG: UbiD family decarboxylase [Nitrospinota bacterium]
MTEDIRSLLARMEESGDLKRIKEEVDPRHISPLVEKNRKECAVLIEKVKGYDIPVLSGFMGTRKRLAISMGAPEAELGHFFMDRLNDRIPPVIVEDAPCQEVVKTGAEVDLTEFPIPLHHKKDGGPYISAGVVVSRSEDGVRNGGMYRLMYRKPNETSIDLVSPSDMRFFYQRALDRGEPLPIAIAVGCHPLDMLATGYQAVPGDDEFGIAGSFHGEPVQLVKCKTVDLEVPANAEFVMEGELEPIGWTADEGRFGDFTGHECSIRWNPTFKIKAITRRKAPIFYHLQMPWENMWMTGPQMEAMGYRVLKEASIQVKSVYATPGSCCFWHLVASIDKRPGEGKNAVMALLSLSAVKMVIVTDSDVDIFDPVALDRALTFRVQADKDVMIISGGRGKHLDPSVMMSKLPKGTLPTTAKMGIDATIPEGVDLSEYELSEYPWMDEV